MEAEKNLEYYMSLPYIVVVMHDPSGGFVAKVAELRGCITQAETWEELGYMIRDAMEGWLSVGIEYGDPIPEPDGVFERI